MSIFASTESPFRFTQDYRPRLSSVAPCGAGAWWRCLCSSTRSVRLTGRFASNNWKWWFLTYFWELAPRIASASLRPVPGRAVWGYLCFAIACGASLFWRGSDARPLLR